MQVAAQTTNTGAVMWQSPAHNPPPQIFSIADVEAEQIERGMPNCSGSRRVYCDYSCRRDPDRSFVLGSNRNCKGAEVDFTGGTRGSKLRKIPRPKGRALGGKDSDDFFANSSTSLLAGDSPSRL